MGNKSHEKKRHIDPAVETVLDNFIGFELDCGQKSYLSGPNTSAIRCYNSGETIFIG